MPLAQIRRFLTPTEAATYLGGRSTRRTVVTLINKGLLKGKKVAREWRILPEWLDEYMSEPDQIPKRNNHTGMICERMGDQKHLGNDMPAKEQLSIADLERMDNPIITAAQAAPFVSMDPNTIRRQARRDPTRLGFQVIVAGNRVKIPRLPFIQFIKGKP